MNSSEQWFRNSCYELQRNEEKGNRDRVPQVKHIADMKKNEGQEIKALIQIEMKPPITRFDSAILPQYIDK